MANDDEARRSRAAARGDWTGSVASLGDARAPGGGTPADGLRAVWRITCDAWALSGRPQPEYSRAGMPGRVIRPRDEG